MFSALVIKTNKRVSERLARVKFSQEWSSYIYVSVYTVVKLGKSRRQWKIVGVLLLAHTFI